MADSIEVAFGVVLLGAVVVIIVKAVLAFLLGWDRGEATRPPRIDEDL